jgi:hypothetical protein
MNRSGRHILGLTEFRDALSLVIIYFGGEIGDGSPYGEISLIRCCRHHFSYFAS